MLAGERGRALVLAFGITLVAVAVWAATSPGWVLIGIVGAGWLAAVATVLVVYRRSRRGR